MSHSLSTKKCISNQAVTNQVEYKLRDKGKVENIICLTKEEEVNSSNIKLRLDLMSDKFPSIWLEVLQDHNKNILVCGLYRYIHTYI